MRRLKADERAIASVRVETGFALRTSRITALTMKGVPPSLPSYVSLDLGDGHFWCNGVWVEWARRGALCMADHITLFSTEHVQRQRETPHPERRARAHHAHFGRWDECGDVSYQIISTSPCRVVPSLTSRRGHVTNESWTACYRECSD